MMKREDNRLLGLAAVAVGVAALAITALVVRSYLHESRRIVETVASAAEIALDAERESVDEAAGRMSHSARTTALLKEGDPFSTVVGLNRQLREEALDFAYLLLTPGTAEGAWVEAASLSYSDKQEPRLTALQRHFSRGSEHIRGYLCHDGALYAVARREISLWDAPAATILAGRKLSGSERVRKRFERLLGDGSDGAALAVLCGSHPALAIGAPASAGVEGWSQVLSPSGLRFAIAREPRALTHALIKAALAFSALILLAFAGIRQRLRQAKAKEQHAKAALSALMRQMSPHFLFNALNTVSSVLRSDPALARSLLDDLATIYRQIVESTKREVVPLATELAIVESYLRIQAARFEERLRWSIEAKVAQWQETPVPPLLIQTLVENAIKHGISEAVAGGEIRILLEAHSDGIRIRILNNGEPLSPEFREGTGIANSRERLALLHGGRSELRLATTEDGWTEASVVLRRNPA